MKQFIKFLLVFVVAVICASFSVSSSIHINENQAKIVDIYYDDFNDGVITYHAVGIAPVSYNNKVKYIVDFDINKTIFDGQNDNSFVFAKGELFSVESLNHGIRIDMSTFSCKEDKTKSSNNKKYYQAKFKIADQNELSDEIVFEFFWNMKGDLLDENTNY